MKSILFMFGPFGSFHFYLGIRFKLDNYPKTELISDLDSFFSTIGSKIPWNIRSATIRQENMTDLEYVSM